MTAARQFDGVLPSGGSWSIDLPAAWSGTLLLYSAGYGGDEGGRVDTAGDPLARELLLDAGYALAGSRPSGHGWVVGESLEDQVATLAEFRTHVGTPAHTLAWGHSMGGLIAAGLAQRAPDGIDGAVAMCASVAGPIPMLNQGLDAAFVLTTLIGASDVALVGVVDDAERFARGGDVVAHAMTSPHGRARLALAAAIGQFPTWSADNMTGFRPEPPQPAPDDIAAILANQASVFAWAAFSPRADLERRAGGNFSWNTGIDYADQLARSGSSPLVARVYDAAGLSLADDLDRLEDADRIAADPAAVAAMERNLTPDGHLGIPVLTVLITGDFAPTVSQASAYRDVVRESGSDRLLRQAYVHAPGHCRAFSSAEVVASIDAMAGRVASGGWPDLDASTLNDAAARVGAGRAIRPRRPRFGEFEPPTHLRPHPRSARLEPLSGPRS